MLPEWPTGRVLSGAHHRLSLSICSLQRFAQRAMLSTQQPWQHKGSGSSGRPLQRPLGSFLKPAIGGCLAGGGMLLAGAQSPQLMAG